MMNIWYALIVECVTGANISFHEHNVIYIAYFVQYLRERK